MYKQESKYIQLEQDEKTEIRLIQSSITPLIEEVCKKYKKKKDRVLKAIKKEGCNHFYFDSHPERVDDGYGKFWTIISKTCKVCGEHDSYHKWPLNNE